jgi:hypothetical protein
MSATELVLLLHRLGYEQPVEESSVDWCFEFESVLPFFKWICHHLSKENIISQTKVEEYETLKKQGKIVEGEELEQLIATLEQSDHVKREDLQFVPFSPFFPPSFPLFPFLSLFSHQTISFHPFAGSNLLR